MRTRCLGSLLLYWRQPRPGGGCRGCSPSCRGVVAAGGGCRGCSPSCWAPVAWLEGSANQISLKFAFAFPFYHIVSVSQLVVTVANSERRNCNGMAQGGNDVDELADVLTQLLVGGLQLRESLGDRLWVTWGW